MRRRFGANLPEKRATLSVKAGVSTLRVNSKSQKQNFKYHLSQINWQTIINSTEKLEINFQNFLNTLLLVFEEHFPKKAAKSKRDKNSKPWITVGLKTSLIKKKEMSYKVKNSTDLNFITYYKSYVNILRKLIQISKKTCYEQILKKSENKTKTMWSNVRKETGREAKRMDISSILIKDKLVSDKHLMAEQFNKYFFSPSPNL